MFSAISSTAKSKISTQDLSSLSRMEEKKFRSSKAKWNSKEWSNSLKTGSWEDLEIKRRKSLKEFSSSEETLWFCSLKTILKKELKNLKKLQNPFPLKTKCTFWLSTNLRLDLGPLKAINLKKTKSTSFQIMPSTNSNSIKIRSLLMVWLNSQTLSSTAKRRNFWNSKDQPKIKSTRQLLPSCLLVKTSTIKSCLTTRMLLFCIMTQGKKNN